VPPLPILDGLHDVFEFTQVLLPDDLRLASDPLALSGVVVGVTLDLFLRDARHG